MAEGRRIQARRIVVATGSSPAVPRIPGLAEVRHLTNETVFELTEQPEHLIVIGGGPIGCEGSERTGAWARGSPCSSCSGILPKDDPDAVRIVRDQLLAEGIDLREHVQVKRIAPEGNVSRSPSSRRDPSSELQVVTCWSLPGVAPMSMASGSRPPASSTARRASRSTRGCARATSGRMPSATSSAAFSSPTLRRTTPASFEEHPVQAAGQGGGTCGALGHVYRTELAHVGLTEALAKERGVAVQALRWSFEENDRARTERDTGGFAKVLVDRRGRIQGATIVGKRAGELIHTWVLALSQGIKLGAMAQFIAPYPTLGEVSKRAAGSYYAPKLFSDRTRRLVRFLMRFG